MITQWIYGDAYSNSNLAISAAAALPPSCQCASLCVSSLMIPRVFPHRRVNTWDSDRWFTPSVPPRWRALLCFFYSGLFSFLCFFKHSPVFILPPSYRLRVTCAHSRVLHTRWMQINTLVRARGELCRWLTASCLVSLAVLRCEPRLRQTTAERTKIIAAPGRLRHAAISRSTFAPASLASSLLWRSCLWWPLTTASRWRPTALWWRSPSSSPPESPSSPRRSTGLSPLRRFVIQSLRKCVKIVAGCVQHLMWGCLILFTFWCYFFVSYRALNYLQWPWRYNFLARALSGKNNNCALLFPEHSVKCLQIFLFAKLSLPCMTDKWAFSVNMH